MKPHRGKELSRSFKGEIYARYPIRTHLIEKGDDIVHVVKDAVYDLLKKGDILAISERVVAISQGRSFLIDDIRPGIWARLLYRFVYKNPGGIGLRSPWTMQLAIDEAGLLRILGACAASLFTKPFGMRGVFYTIAGHNINAIDGPCDYSLPPSNISAKLGPKDPSDVAQKISQACKGIPVAIIDANDLGVNVLGCSDDSNEELIRELCKDNPLGQSKEQTPILLIRKA